MKDRAMQALYLLALDPVAETRADPNSYGFRKERSCADAIGQIHTVLSNRAGARWILEADIRACFDQISHDWLEANTPMNKTILRKWLKAGYIDKHVLQSTEEGTPQGGIATPPTMLQKECETSRQQFRASDCGRNMAMDLRAHRWKKVEESSQMRSEDKPKKTRKISRKYEPDRLSLTRLADAYEKVVPRYIRILGEWSIETKNKKGHEQDVIGERNG